VTVTDKNGCPSVIEESILVLDCETPCPCGGNSQVIIDAGEGTSFADPNLGFLQHLTLTENGYEWNGENGCLSIKGKLIIDNVLNDDFHPLYDLLIFADEKLTIQMQPGASVEVVDGAKLHIESRAETAEITMFSCLYLWKGMNVIDGELKLDGVVLSNAQLGVNVHDGSSAWLLDNEFSQNFISLFHFGSGDINLLTSGNKFYGSTNLLPSLDFDYETLTGLSIQGHTYAGAYFNSYLYDDNTIFFGNSIAPNEFAYLPIGIRALGSANLVIPNEATFTDIQPSSIYSFEDGGGRAVYMNGSKTNILKQVDGVFTDCLIGIDASYCSTKLVNNQLTCDQTAIQVAYTEEGFLIVNDNSIDMNSGGVGIHLIGNDIASTLEVSGNNITLNVPDELEFNDELNAGVKVDESLFRIEPVLARLKENIIDINVGTNAHGAGIFLQGVRHLDVTNHEHIVCETAESIGISIHGSENNTIKYNDITGTSLALVGTGMEVLASSDNYISCNYFHQLHTGARFGIGNSEDTELHRNVFDPPLVDGLRYENFLDITSQDWEGNQWLGAAEEYLGDAAVNEAEDLADLIQHNFKIHSLGDDYFPPSISTPTLPDGESTWFTFNDDNTPELCTSTSSTIDPPEGISDEKIEYYDSIMNREEISGYFGTTRNWETLRQNYSKISVASTFSDVLAEKLSVFRASVLGQEVDAFESVKEELSSLFRMEEDTREQLSYLQDNKAAVLDDLQVNLVNENQLVVQASFLAETKLAMSDLNAEIKTLLDPLVEAQVEDATLLADEIAALSTTITPQANEKLL
ncbi:MAG: NosD domain-containing protein, partial [Bacteroidota bacterium]